VGDKIILFLENQFQSLFRIDFIAFCKMIMDLINTGPDCYKRLVFACLSLSNQGRICEHDLFSMIENFKQRDSYFFYKELIDSENVPRDYQSVVDFSDKIFFEAFSNDVKVISKALKLRKFMQNQDDKDSGVTLEEELENLLEQTEEEIDFELANHIDYCFGVINKKGNSLIQQ